MTPAKLILLAACIALFVAVLWSPVHAVWVALLALAARACIAAYALARRRAGRS